MKWRGGSDRPAASTAAHGAGAAEPVQIDPGGPDIRGEVDELRQPRARKSDSSADEQTAVGKRHLHDDPFITASVILPLLSKRKVTLYANGMLVSECPFALNVACSLAWKIWLVGVPLTSKKSGGSVALPVAAMVTGKAQVSVRTPVSGEREFRLDRGVSCGPRREQGHHGEPSKGSQCEAPRESLHLLTSSATIADQPSAERSRLPQLRRLIACAL